METVLLANMTLEQKVEFLLQQQAQNMKLFALMANSFEIVKTCLTQPESEETLKKIEKLMLENEILSKELK